MGKTIFHADSSGMSIIPNTKKAQYEYGLLFGYDHILITEEHIKALREGKQLAFNDGEYSNFLSMSKPK